MKSKRILFLLIAVVVIPGGMLLLAPYAVRAFGSVMAVLRSQLIAASMFGWIAYQSITHLRTSPESSGPALLS